LKYHSETAFAFRDEIVHIENYFSQISIVVHEKDIIAPQTIEKGI
jgi:hypothetical protein